MIKFRAHTSSGYVEFKSEADAQNYATQNQGTIEPLEYNVEAPKKVVPNVTPRQIRLAMLQSGINLSSVDALIAAMPEPDQSVAKIYWEYALEFERNHDLVAALGAAYGLNEEQLDALWELAGSL